MNSNAVMKNFAKYIKFFALNIKGMPPMRCYLVSVPGVFLQKFLISKHMNTTFLNLTNKINNIQSYFSTSKRISLSFTSRHCGQQDTPSFPVQGLTNCTYRLFIFH